jgi:hypothetical protein
LSTRFEGKDRKERSEKGESRELSATRSLGVEGVPDLADRRHSHGESLGQPPEIGASRRGRQPRRAAPPSPRRAAQAIGDGRPRRGPGPGLNDRLHRTSLSVFTPPSPDKSSDRPPEDRTSLRPPTSRRRGRSGMICPPVGTTDGAICLLLAPFCLHRGHHAGVVPALAHVLLVRRVTSVLAAVVAAELLTWLDLTSAPHVLAVHPTSHPSPARRRKTSPVGAPCMRPARRVNLSGFTGSVPWCVHPPPPRTTDGPPTGCPRRRGERRTQRSHSIVARNTSGAPRLESPASASAVGSESSLPRRSGTVA